MSLINHIQPTYYRVKSLLFVRDASGLVTAAYDVNIYNANREQITSINPTVTLTQQEKAAIANIYQRDQVLFEQNTGLQPLPGV